MTQKKSIKRRAEKLLPTTVPKRLRSKPAWRRYVTHCKRMDLGNLVDIGHRHHIVPRFMGGSSSFRVRRQSFGLVLGDSCASLSSKAAQCNALQEAASIPCTPRVSGLARSVILQIVRRARNKANVSFENLRRQSNRGFGVQNCLAPARCLAVEGGVQIRDLRRLLLVSHRVSGSPDSGRFPASPS